MVTNISLINHCNKLWSVATGGGIRRYSTYSYSNSVDTNYKHKKFIGHQKLISNILPPWIFTSVTLVAKRTLISLKDDHTLHNKIDDTDLIYTITKYVKP